MAFAFPLLSRKIGAIGDGGGLMRNVYYDTDGINDNWWTHDGMGWDAMK